MSLTRDDWLKVILAVGGIILTVILNILVVKEWRKADVRYATGSSYISPKLAVSSVAMKNWGGSNAEDVTITALFPDPLTAISPGPMGTHFDLTDGGPGHKFVVGTIKRLVPGEIVSIFFITEPSSPGVDHGSFIRDIKSNHGRGKTGTPILRIWVPSLLIAGVVWLVIWLLSNYLARRHLSNYHAQLIGAIQRGLSARQEGVSEEQLRVRVEEWHKLIPLFSRPRRETLIACAHAAFTGAGHAPTQTAGQVTKRQACCAGITWARRADCNLC